MKKNEKKWIDNFVSENITISVILIYNMVNLCVGLIFYPIIPILMSYPPDVFRVKFELGASYTIQYLVIMLISFIIGTAVVTLALRRVSDWRKTLKESTLRLEKVNLVNRMRSKFINIPYFIFAIQFLIVIPLIIVFLAVRAMTGFPITLFIKLSIIVLSLYYLVSVFTYTFSSRIMKRILLDEYKGESLAGFRIGLKNKFFIQGIPMIIVAVLFTSLLGYSRLIKEKGDFIFLFLKDNLVEEISTIETAEDQEQIFNILKKIKINGVKSEYFIMNSNGELISHDNIVFNEFYKYFIKNPINGDRVYGDTEELQGVVAKVKSKLGLITVGIRFEVASKNTVLVFVLGFVSLLGVTVFILYCFSKNMAKDIEAVTLSINEIAEGKEVDLRRRIPVTSNDEIGDLVVAFNKIRKREYEYDNLRNQFFSNISHELRTPINIILTTIQFIEKYLIENINTNENNKVKMHLGVMKKNGFRLIRLVNNIIDSTRIDESTFKVNLQNLDLVSHVKETTYSVAEYIRGKGLNIRFEANVKSMITAFDQDLVERIMLNLLSNAVKFTNEGGEIVVEVNATDETINISVRDNGIGIALDKQSIIFERFRQVENTLKRNYEGSGIGLSLVKTFVEMNGGIITVKSELGKGSEFTIELPVRTIPAEPGECANEEKVERGMEMVRIELADLK